MQNFLNRENPFQNQKSPVKQPPDDKVPARTVPQAGQEKHNHQIAIGFKRSLAIAAQRNIQIFLKPSRQRKIASGARSP